MVESAVPGRDGPDDLRPLVVDVEHALLRADPRLEALVVRAKSRARHVLATLAGLGEESVQSIVAGPDAALLPVDERVVALARSAAESGRPVHLCAARDGARAEELRRRFPFVAGSFSGTPDAPLEGEARARTLAARFPLGFDYVGGSSSDRPVFERASTTILVGVPEPIARGLASKAAFIETLPELPWLGALARALRLRQWVKNVLVLAPLVLGGKILDPGALASTVAALLAMCLVASATYVFNDILDIEDDRRHWSKRQRPLAAGQLSLAKALSAAAACLVAGLGIGALIGSSALAAIVTYVVLTIAYSVQLKRLPVIDGLTLAGLYTLRLVVGIAAAGVPPSPWLLVFSMFLFMSLSLAKRYGELQRAIEKGQDRMHGRGYRREDLPLVLALGVAAGVSAVIIVVFYILDDAFRQSFYGSTAWLWGFPPLMFLLVARMWLLVVRGEMSDDPIEGAMRDRASQIVLMMLLVCFTVAWLG